MSLLQRLLGPPTGLRELTSELAELRATTARLERRLAGVEEEEAARELRLGRLAGDIRRHFKSLQELDRRARAREDDGEGDDDAELDAELARLKLRVGGK